MLLGALLGLGFALSAIGAGILAHWCRAKLLVWAAVRGGGRVCGFTVGYLLGCALISWGMR